MKKVKFIDRSTYSKCRACLGVGYVASSKRTKDKRILGKKCSTCSGTGEWRSSNYILIATDNRGQKIAFSVGGIK